MTTIILAVF